MVFQVDTVRLRGLLAIWPEHSLRVTTNSSRLRRSDCTEAEPDGRHTRNSCNRLLKASRLKPQKRRSLHHKESSGYVGVSSEPRFPGSCYYPLYVTPSTRTWPRLFAGKSVVQGLRSWAAKFAVRSQVRCLCVNPLPARPLLESNRFQ